MKIPGWPRLSLPFSQEDGPFADLRVGQVPGAAPQPEESTPGNGHGAPAPAAVTDGFTVLYAPDGGSAATAGGAGTGAGGSVSTSSSATGSAFTINIAWDASVASAPAEFMPAVIAAANFLERQFTDAVTVNLSIGWGEVNGAALGGGTLGASQSYLSSYSYSSLRGAVAADATSAEDQAAAASLPASQPVTGKFWTTTAEAKALGLAAANGTATDGFIGFSSTLPFDYNNSDGVTGGTWDFNAVAMHEMTEVMGRILLTGANIGGLGAGYTPFDLMHYSSAGVRDFVASTPGYFSVDGGVTNLGNFNTVGGGDAGDWASGSNDAFNAFSNSGVVNAVTLNDLRAVDAVGWNRAGRVSATPATGALTAAQGSSGLVGGVALATLSQSGMPAGDSFSYALGGTGAASFAIAGATLTAGAGGVAGAAGGKVYGLTLTATDTTTGSVGPASPFDVIVASGGGETVNIATLTGALGTATPSFVYGLAGTDTINGAGMTGKLFIDGGAGADKLTGGSGANVYLYGATSDSTAAAMDSITNFAVAKDLIDLSGLGTALAYAGKLGGTSIPAHSIGWQVSNRTTYVYVNNSGATESLSAPDMKIGLSGSLTLASGNFVHM